LHALGAYAGPYAAQTRLAAQVNLFAQVQVSGDTFLIGTIVTAIGIPAALLLPGKRRPS
jgi:hypothetical protein